MDDVWGPPLDDRLAATIHNFVVSTIDSEQHHARNNQHQKQTILIAIVESWVAEGLFIVMRFIVALSTTNITINQNNIKKYHLTCHLPMFCLVITQIS